MKKIISVNFFVFLFLFALIKPVFSQTVTPETLYSPTPVIETVNYELPYPGMLPDNPLYFLKETRDNIIEFLISTPIKKAEFYLLSSDKNLATAKMLIDKNNDSKGIEFVVLSNKNMQKSINSSAKTGAEQKGVLVKIESSIKKHKEVIEKLRKEVDKKNSSKLKKEIDKLVKMQKQISK